MRRECAYLVDPSVSRYGIAAVSLVAGPLRQAGMWTGC